MEQFTEGDRIRVDVPDETDPDHERLHGTHGTVTAVLQDDADVVTGHDREGEIYRVNLDNGEMVDLRWRDLRPPLE